MKKDNDQSFIAQHLPRHEPLENLQKLMSAPKQDFFKSFSEYQGTFAATADARSRHTPNLVELYLGNDIRVLIQDAAERPTHYDDRQHTILMLLSAGKGAAHNKITDLEMNELLLQYMRPTEIAQKSKKIEKKLRAQKDEDEIVMADGKTLEEHLDDEKQQKAIDAVFEDQDSFGDKVIL
jgi:hypothetical protein